MDYITSEDEKQITSRPGSDREECDNHMIPCDDILPELEKALYVDSDDRIGTLHSIRKYFQDIKKMSKAEAVSKFFI